VNSEETIFEHALGIRSPPAREAYLRDACVGDAALLERLQGLLGAHDRAGRFLEHAQPAVEASGLDLGAVPSPPGGTTILPLTEKAGDRIGRYKLLEKIGEGGCGVVYMAEQEEPVRRRVALKVIKLGMDTESVIARFEAERQALAMMDHPNIAKVLDGGVTETGRPYFVMELVRGTKITEYCDHNNLTTPQRLDLFILDTAVKGPNSGARHGKSDSQSRTSHGSVSTAPQLKSFTRWVKPLQLSHRPPRASFRHFPRLRSANEPSRLHQLRLLGSCKSAAPSSTRIKRASFIATSNLPTSWSRSMTASRCRK
jgi:hypothetical protein